MHVCWDKRTKTAPSPGFVGSRGSGLELTESFQMVSGEAFSEMRPTRTGKQMGSTYLIIVVRTRLTGGTEEHAASAHRPDGRQTPRVQEGPRRWCLSCPGRSGRRPRKRSVCGRLRVWRKRLGLRPYLPRHRAY